MSRLRKILAGRSGEGYIDVAVLILCVMLVLALSVKILPVFIAKQQLDTYATELCREAEISGRWGRKRTEGPRFSPSGRGSPPILNGRTAAESS